MKIIKYIFSGEFLFGLFVIAGSFKSLINIPYIDVTILLFIITLLIAIKNLLFGQIILTKKIIIPLILFILIIAISIFSFLYTPSSDYSETKIIRFSLITGWCYIGIFFLFKNYDSIKKFLTAILCISILMSLSILSNGLSNDLNFQTTFGSSYIALARNCAMGSLILIMVYIFNKNNKLIKYITLLFSALLIVPLIQSGARLPLLIFFVLLLIIPFSMIKFHNNNIYISRKIIPFMIILIILTISFSILLLNGYAELLLYRLNVMINEQGGGLSIIERTSRFDTAWKMILSSYFLGKGIGSFPIYYSGIDHEDYPHNIYLEILSELGIFSFLFFIIIIFISVLTCYKYYNSHNTTSINASIYILLLFWIINSFGSSSLIGDKVFFSLLAISIIMPYLPRDKNLNISS